MSRVVARTGCSPAAQRCVRFAGVCSTGPSHRPYIPTSPDAESHRHHEFDLAAQHLGRRRGERLRPLHQRQRFLVERRKARARHDAGRQNMALAIDAESELGHALLAPGTRLLRIALAMFRAWPRSGYAKLRLRRGREPIARLWSRAPAQHRRAGRVAAAAPAFPAEARPPIAARAADRASFPFPHEGRRGCRYGKRFNQSPNQVPGG